MIVTVTGTKAFTDTLCTVKLATLCVVVVFVIMHPFLGGIKRICTGRRIVGGAFITLVLLVLVVSSALARVVNVRTLFNTFVTKIIVPPDVKFHGIVVRGMRSVTLIFFLPLFFTFAKLHARVKLVGDPTL